MCKSAAWTQYLPPSLQLLRKSFCPLILNLLSSPDCLRIFFSFAPLAEACWWTIHPASKQRSVGEKVRIGDDLILVSVSSERYLVRFCTHLAGSDGRLGHNKRHGVTLSIGSVFPVLRLFLDSRLPLFSRLIKQTSLAEWTLCPIFSSRQQSQRSTIDLS
ncbi:unnamed protein product [Protopolystoma xenopodis]|uniref:Inositol 1,4,5-trisphosphate/ryanodine receptor domain-containing protein n=1 Tax=Protopolystoma xenopodis TaxID=117903 RepID=A0A3S5A8R5_9PLAT|nr:unnamed protein product [Protopolystoma xenopodis]